MMLKVEVGQAGHGAAEINPFHWESLPGYARAAGWRNPEAQLKLLIH